MDFKNKQELEKEEDVADCGGMQPINIFIPKNEDKVDFEKNEKNK